MCAASDVSDVVRRAERDPIEGKRVHLQACFRSTRYPLLAPRYCLAFHAVVVMGWADWSAMRGKGRPPSATCGAGTL